MNKDNASIYLPFVQALADGKTIQILRRNNIWEELSEVCFTYEAEFYRIKPEPIKKWYRVAHTIYGVEIVDNEDDEYHLSDKNLVRWLTDRIEYIIKE